LQFPGGMFDVIVAGGGPAGLSAALMLGRCRRRVLVCDLGEPRNRWARALHGYLSRDGIAPSEFISIGRAELDAYGVECRRVGITDAVWRGSHYEVTVGSRRESTRYLLLATGVIDDRPAIPGLDECYGQTVFHCPYCDGWEWRDRRLAVVGRGHDALGTALALKGWSADVALCTHGGRLDRSGRERLARNHILVRTTPVSRLEHVDGRLEGIVFAAGERLACDALFFATGQHPQSDLAVRLGCGLNRKGTVRTGKGCETNVPNVYVAGDASHDAQFVIVAAAEGVKAAVAINRALLGAELAP